MRVKRNVKRSFPGKLMAVGGSVTEPKLIKINDFRFSI